MTNGQRRFFRRNWMTIFAGLTMLLDILLVAFALGTSYSLNFADKPIGTFLPQQWKLVLYSVILYIFLNAVFGVYRQAYASPFSLQLAGAGRSYVIGTLIIFATLFLFRNVYYSQGALITYGLVVPGVLLLGHFAWERFRRAFHRHRVGFERCLAVLTDDPGSQHPQVLAANEGGTYDVAATFHSPSGREEDDTRRRMNDALREFEPDSIIFIGSSPDLVVPLTLATSLESSGVSVRFVSHEIHDVLARAGLYDRAGIAFVSPKRRPLHAFFKRTFDLAASAVILLVASPVIAAIALAIKAESHGRVFFRQLRSLSPGGPRVSVYKFRSMKTASEDLSENISEIEGRRDLLFKLKDDPRITRIGKFIRKFSLDELPQLLNVVRGEMSLVGPRPLPVPDYGRIVGDETVRMLCDRRSLAKPGMTGLWQVSGRSNLTFREMVILDLYYAENQAILFDLEILLQTIPAVLSGRNAY